MPEAVLDSSPGTRGGSDTTYRTDRKHSGNYDLTRWNACRWQTRRDDVMVCLGDKCRYRFCGYRDEELPAKGTECPWETWYAGKVLDEFDELFAEDGLGKYLDDRPALRREFMLAHLLANRAVLRSSLTLQECFDAVLNRGNMPYDREPFRRYVVAERYRSAAYNRRRAVLDQLPMTLEKLRESRIRTQMLVNGYWNPLKGDAPPSIEDAPEWIIKKVDAG